MRGTASCLLLLVACSASGPGVPEVRWGEDLCSRCRMIVSEPRFAAAVTSGERTIEVFDDVGELVLYLGAHPGIEGTRWVHAFRGEAWIEAEEAAYVVSPRRATPMGHGVVALSDRKIADALAREGGGEVVGWSELAATVAAGVQP